jgi:hypothetical protein
LGFSPNGQACLIFSRKSQRTSGLAGIINQAGNLCWGFIAQIPDEEIQAGFNGNMLDGKIALAFVGGGVGFLFFARERADDFAVGV